MVRYSEPAGRDEVLWQRARAWAVANAAGSLALSSDEPVLTEIAEHSVNQLLDASDAWDGLP